MSRIRHPKLSKPKNVENKPTDQEINAMMDQMEVFMAEGWGINMAMTMAAGSALNRFTIAIGKTQRYLDMLNEYCRKKKKQTWYRDENGSIKQVKPKSKAV